MGAGLTIVSSADIIISAEEGFFSFAETNVGLLGPVFECSRSIPIQVLRYMTLTGAKLSADELYRYGYIFEVVEKDALYGRALEVAQQIEAKPPLVTKEVKIALQRLADIDRLYHLDAVETYWTNETLLKDSHDFREAYTSFLEKRPPRFTGK